MVYADSTDTYHVLANGTIVEQAFEGKVEIVVSADNSFAYVFDDTDNGIVMYLLEGKKCSQLLGGQAVEEIVATATLEPAVIYVDSTGEETNYMIYSEAEGEEQIAAESEKPDNFFISGDGKTVAFNVADRDSADKILCIYEDRNVEEVPYENLIPVAVSNYGDYIYARITEKGVTKLAVYDPKKEDAYYVDGSNGFHSILEMNIKGDEVIFCTASINVDGVEDIITGDALKITSYLYRYKAKSDKALTELGKNFVTTAKADPTIAIHKTFADTYLTSTNGLDGTQLAENATYYLNSKYEKSSIHENYAGKFSPDGKYFYFINKDEKLIRMDLTSSERKTDNVSTKTGIEDFVITEKGNIYFMIGNYLYFYRASTESSRKVNHQAAFMSYYNCSNEVYFSKTESTSIFVSEDSDDEDIAKLDNKEITAVPYFTNPTSKKCYAVVYDSAKENYSIFYTANGSSFDYLKKVDNCAAIYPSGLGSEELDLSEYMPE